MASDYGKEYYSKAECLLSDFLVGLPGLPPEVQHRNTPEFEAALSFALGNALHSTQLDVEPERVAAQVEGVMEKMVLHGHVRSAERMNNALRKLDGENGWLKDHYQALAMLLGIAQAPTATGSHFDKFKAHTYKGDQVVLEEAEVLEPIKTREEEDDETMRAIMTASISAWGEDLQSDSDDGLWFDEDDDDESNAVTDGVTGNRREERKIQKALAEIDSSGNVHAKEQFGIKSDTHLIDSQNVDEHVDEDCDVSGAVQEELQQHHQQEDKEDEDEETDYEAQQQSSAPRNQVMDKFNEVASTKRRLLSKKFGNAHEAMAALSSGSKLHRHQAAPHKESNFINMTIGIDLNSDKESYSNATSYQPAPMASPHSEQIISNGLRNVLMSEGEAVRACIHVLLGIPGPLFHFNDMTSMPINKDDIPSESQQCTHVHWAVLLSKHIGSGRNGNGFKFEHLSSQSLTCCLKKFAEHASDLRFLRDVIIGNDQNFGPTWSAWKSVVDDWMVKSDQQLSQLDKIAYTALRSENPCGKPVVNVTSTLNRLSNILQASARRAQQLRLLCHKLNPFTVNAFKGVIPTAASLRDREDMRDSTELILDNVLFSCRIVDGLWDSLQIVEVCERPKQALSPCSSSFNGELPQPPPLVECSSWLRRAFCVVLRPMIQTWSSWVLEGTLEDPSRESFLSLHVESLIDYHGSQVGKATSSFPLGGAGINVITGKHSTRSSLPSKSTTSTTKDPESFKLPPLSKQVPALFAPCAELILSCGHAVRLMRAAANRIEEHSSNALLRVYRGNLRSLESESEASDLNEEGKNLETKYCWTDSMQWIERSLLKHLEAEKQMRISQQGGKTTPGSDENVFSLVDLFETCCSAINQQPEDTSVMEEEEEEEDKTGEVDISGNTTEDDSTTQEEDTEEVWGGEWDEDRASFAGCEPLQDIKYFTEREVASPFLPMLYKHVSPSKSWHEKKNANLKSVGNSNVKPTFSTTAESLHFNFIHLLMAHCKQANQASAQELLKSGGPGKDLISAFQVLRSIFLGADGLLLNQWRDKLFNISSQFIVSENSHSQEKLFEPGPWMGLRNPLNMDASALSDLFRSSVLDAVAVSRTGFTTMTQTKHGSQKKSFGNHIVYEKFDQHSFSRELIGGSLPFWFIDGGGVLSIDDFRVELMPAAAASNRARKRDVHLRPHVSTLYSTSAGTSSASASTATMPLSPLKSYLMESLGNDEGSILQKADGEGSLLLPSPLLYPACFKNLNDESYIKQSKIYSPGSGGDAISGMMDLPGNSIGNDLAWADGIKQFGWLRLNCNIGWPLNAVVSSKSLNGYNKVWVLLQQVRYAHSALESFRWLLHKQRKHDDLQHVNNQPTSQRSGRVDWHKISVQLGLVVHVISSLQGYLCSHSAVEHWLTLV